MTDTLAVARPAGPSQRPARSLWAALAVVLTGQFMAVRDASVVNVAAPSIHASLHTSGAGLQLVIAGYVITYAVLLVTGARLGDILGHRRMFLAGLAVFTLASLGCGLATSTGVLVTLRFIQGAGAAAMIPQVLSLIQRTFTGAARGRPMRLYAAVLAGGAVTGQVGSGVLFAVFVMVERRAAARGGAPLIPGRLLRLHGTAAGIAALFCVMAVFGGFFFVLALHLQGGLGDSPMRAGLTFAPAGLAFAVVSLNWQRLPAGRPGGVSITGFAVYGAGLLVLAAGGMAAAFSPLMTAVVTRVPVSDAADATGVIVTVNQLALVVGVATFGTLYLNLAGRLPQDAAGGFRLVSAHAVAVTGVVLAAGAVAGGILAALRARTAR